MDKEIIKGLIEEGYSTHMMAKKFGKCQTSITYWLRKFGLKTKYTLVVKLLNICVGCKGATYNKKYCSKKCEGESKIKSSNLKIENGEKVVPSLLRRYVINKDGWVCSECKNIEWNSKHIPLVLDHINGNPYNNSLKNLRMLCCNCDAQTPTYKSKNNGNGRHERMKRYYNKKSY